ncbi:hypothetical protein DPMN_106590 [Dreissena polymorpha]|uniref:Uncharacterized protein n=1 Tax=Dreissena polymorpha TaxID=45954 RepID=A0A9D4K5H5_DREPO|nr:hypothetical protein DPMN_106590 [Dreissena polymorpha]
MNQHRRKTTNQDIYLTATATYSTRATPTSNGQRRRSLVKQSMFQCNVDNRSTSFDLLCSSSPL